MNWRMFLIIPPIVVGVLVFNWMTGGQGYTDQADIPEAALAVRVATVQPETFVATAEGFGRVEPVKTWQAISQVSGRAITVSPNIAVGQLVEAGELLIKVDPRDYEISLTKAKTAVSSAKAAINELQTDFANTKAKLELENEILASYQKELERQTKLLERGSVSQTTLDTANRTALSQHKLVLDLNNALTQFPVRRESLQATLESRLASQEEAQRALSNVDIRAPFAGRVVMENVSDQEYVRTGNVLLEIEDISASNITAEFQPSVLSALFRSITSDRLDEFLNLLDTEQAFSIVTRLDLTVEVELTIGTAKHKWPAQIIRIDGSTDAHTGTLGVVVRVADPGRPNPVTKRPPLSNGSFVLVRLLAPAKADAILVDRDALRVDESGNNFVYVADAKNRLRRAAIKVAAISGARAVVASGLVPGDTLILSDPQPAIQGMLLNLVTTDQVQ